MFRVGGENIPGSFAGHMGDGSQVWNLVRIVHLTMKTERWDDEVFHIRAFPESLCISWQLESEGCYSLSQWQEIMRALDEAAQVMSLENSGKQDRGLKRVWAIEATPADEGSIVMAVPNTALFWGMVSSTHMSDTAFKYESVLDLKRTLEDLYADRLNEP